MFISIDNDELLDLVNEHDEVIAQEYRSTVYRHEYSNFRVVNAFIINDKNEIWIPIRSAHKKLFPHHNVGMKKLGSIPYNQSELWFSRRYGASRTSSLFHPLTP